MKTLHNTTKYVLLFVALLIGTTNINAQLSTLKSNFVKEAMVEAVNAGREEYKSGMDFNSYTLAIGVDSKKLSTNESLLLTDVYNYIKSGASDSQIKATYDGNSFLNFAQEKETPFSNASTTQKGFFSRLIGILQQVIVVLEQMEHLFLLIIGIRSLTLKKAN